MKIKLVILLALGLSLGLFGTSCDTFENPNAASEDQVLTTVDGLFALAIGMKREYQINSYDEVVRASGTSAREFGVVVGFTSPLDLEEGGLRVTSENAIVGRIWESSYRIMGMAEDLIASTDIVGDDATRNAFLATGHLFKAITLGSLYMFWESFPSSADPSGMGEFIPRRDALGEAIASLEAGISALGGADVPAGFQSTVFGTSNFDLGAVLQAYLARCNGFLGNDSGAITAADQALSQASTISEWSYETAGGNFDPMWDETTDEPATYKPLDNFGLDPAEYVVPPEDGRIAFYLEPGDEIGLESRLPVEIMRGFYDEPAKATPVYLPGEMYLIKAEAQARSGDLGGAVSSLNMVREKTVDPFGVAAGLGPYDGAMTEGAVLEDVYRHRRVELFLTGMSLEDSRRFGRPLQSSTPDFDSYDRNLDFYPVPQEEVDNNSNAPR